MRKLLKESDIRQMMKLANIPALSDPFINKLNETSIYEQDEEEDDAMAGPPVDPMGEPPEDPMGEPPEDPMGEPSAEEPDELGATGGVTVESALEGLSSFLEGVSDPEVGPQIAGRINVDMEDQADAGLGDEEGLDMGPEDEEGLDMGPEDEEAEGPPGGEDDLLKDLEEAQIDLEEDESLVSEVVRRVAKRLLKR